MACGRDGPAYLDLGMRVQAGCTQFGIERPAAAAGLARAGALACRGIAADQRVRG